MLRKFQMPLLQLALFESVDEGQITKERKSQPGVYLQIKIICF